MTPPFVDPDATPCWIGLVQSEARSRAQLTRWDSMLPTVATAVTRGYAGMDEAGAELDTLRRYDYAYEAVSWLSRTGRKYEAAATGGRQVCSCAKPGHLWAVVTYLRTCDEPALVMCGGYAELGMSYAQLHAAGLWVPATQEDFTAQFYRTALNSAFKSAFQV